NDGVVLSLGVRLMKSDQGDACGVVCEAAIVDATVRLDRLLQIREGFLRNWRVGPALANEAGGDQGRDAGPAEPWREGAVLALRGGKVSDGSVHGRLHVFQVRAPGLPGSKRQACDQNRDGWD